MITIEDFRKCELVVARILEVQDHPNADKLYLIKVDLGTEVRQLVAGIKPSYTKEELINKEVVVVKNLQPAVIRGVESQGMILAATDTQGICLVSPLRDVAIGSIVK